MIRTVAMGEEEPGLRPLSSALEDEGFDDLGSDRLVESFARHLMSAIDAWQEKGFGEIDEELSAAARRPRTACARRSTRTAISWCGAWPRRSRCAHSLVSALSRASWLDPETGGPRK